MLSKDTIAIVHILACINYMCVIWNTDIGRVLKHSKCYF